MSSNFWHAGMRLWNELLNQNLRKLKISTINILVQHVLVFVHGLVLPLTSFLRSIIVIIFHLFEVVELCFYCIYNLSITCWSTMIILGICTELCVHLYFYSSLQFTSVHILILSFAGALFQPLDIISYRT